jgi:hypothetical protein
MKHYIKIINELIYVSITQQPQQSQQAWANYFSPLGKMLNFGGDKEKLDEKQQVRPSAASTITLFLIQI